VKALVHSHALDAETFLESVGVQALYAKDVVQLGAIDSAIDKVSADQLNQLAKKVINGKPTLAVVGDLTYAPYLDEVVPPRA
jgi:predicted Zn-dependent peptidase